MIEVQWGTPIALHTHDENDFERFSTIEKARHWLRRKWPVADDARQVALEKIEAAMECMSPVTEARRAFVVAATSAGYVPTVAH
jgi:hypothetical protein